MYSTFLYLNLIIIITRIQINYLCLLLQLNISVFIELFCDNNYFFFRGPVPVLVMSLLFIASVFLLHIWGKYNRA